MKTDTAEPRYVYVNIRFDLETKQKLEQYAEFQMRTIPITGGLIIKQFFNAHQEKKEEQASLNSN